MGITFLCVFVFKRIDTENGFSNLEKLNAADSYP